ncbi:hypothetical protein HK096_007636, partial [Nowakowskiella sp. JEL0078]
VLAGDRLNSKSASTDRAQEHLKSIILSQQSTAGGETTWTKYTCERCRDNNGEPRIFVGRHEWEVHEKSRAHKKALSVAKNGSRREFREMKMDFPALQTSNTRNTQPQPQQILHLNAPQTQPAAAANALQAPNLLSLLSQQNMNLPLQLPIGSMAAQQPLLLQSQQLLTLSSSLQGSSWGLLGLIDLIRPTNQSKTLLSGGADLTNLGLNLNALDSLNSTFVSPYSEDPMQNSEPQYILPDCYNLPQPAPPLLSKISSFSDETLFFIFYTLPRETAQEAAAQELYNRNWRFHKDLKVWLTKEPSSEVVVKTVGFERGAYIFFDPTTWQKVKKELVLYYEQLEERGLVGDNSATTLSSSTLSNVQGRLATLGVIGSSTSGNSLPNLAMNSIMTSGPSVSTSVAPGLSSSVLGISSGVAGLSLNSNSTHFGLLNDRLSESSTSIGPTSTAATLFGQNFLQRQQHQSQLQSNQLSQLDSQNSQSVLSSSGLAGQFSALWNSNGINQLQNQTLYNSMAMQQGIPGLGVPVISGGQVSGNSQAQAPPVGLGWNRQRVEDYERFIQPGK